MRAVVWKGKTKVAVEEVPEPQIEEPTDIIVRVTAAAICGSDLHLYGGYIPTMESGDILGHEFMGEVVEAGAGVKQVKIGDRVVIPFHMSCGECFYCQRKLYSVCERSNRKRELAEKMYGQSTAGLFGYSHLTGGYPGGQAELVRVPFANFGAYKVPDSLSDEKALFLGDIVPTGWMAAENAEVKAGDTVAVWGAGPVGQFAVVSAQLMGAARVYVIDHISERLDLAAEAGAVPINFDETKDVTQTLKDLTDGRGPDAVIDAVGLEAHAEGVTGAYDKAKQAVKLETDRPTALRQVIQTCRPGGVVSIPGVYGGFADKLPLGAAFNKGLTFRMGQTHVHRYVDALMERVIKGQIDPSMVITHRVPLDDAPEMYELFRAKQDGCIKVVLKP